jgi:hypothetical protein
LPEIDSTRSKEMKQDMARSLSNERFEQGKFFTKRQSNFKQYEQKISTEEPSKSVPLKVQKKHARNELDLISTIMMPESLAGSQEQWNLN